MPEIPGRDGGAPPPDADDGTGEPVYLLGELGQEPSAQFIDKLRRRIDRRVTVSHVVTFGWRLPRLVLIEMLDLAFQVFGSRAARKGDRP